METTAFLSELPVSSWCVAWPSRRAVARPVAQATNRETRALVKRSPGTLRQDGPGLVGACKSSSWGVLRKLRNTEKRKSRSWVRLGAAQPGPPMALRWREPWRASGPFPILTLLPMRSGSDALFCNPFCHVCMLRLRKGCDLFKEQPCLLVADRGPGSRFLTPGAKI